MQCIQDVPALTLIVAAEQDDSNRYSSESACFAAGDLVFQCLLSVYTPLYYQ